MFLQNIRRFIAIFKHYIVTKDFFTLYLPILCKYYTTILKIDKQNIKLLKIGRF